MSNRTVEFSAATPALGEPAGYVGQALRRDEDLRLTTGRGRYTDDIRPAGTLVACFARSSHGHARITRLDVEAARRMPGVIAVLTGADWAATGGGAMPCLHPVFSTDGSAMREAGRPVLAGGKVRHVGEPIAAVIAISVHAGLDAVDAIEIDYESLPAVIRPDDALAPGAPLLHEAFGNNVAYQVEHGDRARTEAVFASADHVTELEFRNTRVCGNPMEPRAYLARYDDTDDRITLWGAIQNPHLIRRLLAKHVFRMPEHKLRVIAPDVGGGFGPKAYCYSEMVVVVWAARLLGRPVRWTSTRSELLVSDAHARDFVTKARMAFTKEGRILGLACQTVAGFGGYQSTFSALIPGQYFPPMLNGPYDYGAAHVDVKAVYNNATPTDAYRGSIQAAVTIYERLVDNAARELGIDPSEMRLRNYIKADAYPYKTALGAVYESGNLQGQHQIMLDMANYAGLRREQAALRTKGVRMGLGFAAIIESAGMGPSRAMAKKGAQYGTAEAATMRVLTDGRVAIFVGTHSHGQSHDVTYRQIAADALQIPIDDIAVHQGDTDTCPGVFGTGAARSLSVCGMAIAEAGTRVIKKAKILAAHRLETAEDDVDYVRGNFVVTGTDRRISFAEVAELAHLGSDYPDGFQLGLDETVYFDPTHFNYPTALHLAVVLVDEDTGVVTLRNYYCVDDCGRVINPMVVHGQVHGGLVQGIGQALTEEVVYDENGQLLTGSFMDYGMPRADLLPTFALAFQETLNPHTALGVKGCSESGTCGPVAAIGNAILDALNDYGIEHLQHPYTSLRVWQAIQDAKGDRAA